MFAAPTPSCSESPLKEKTRSTDRFVQIELDVKDWFSSTPSVDAVRPGRCPACGVASRPVGKRLFLHGHGVRVRQLQGPLSADGPSEIIEVRLRRYRCTPCSAVIIVGPRGLVHRRLYSAAAIGLSLALWSLQNQPAAEVRRQVSPWAVVGAAAATSWATLRRWSRALKTGELWPRLMQSAPAASTLRQSAEAAAVRLAALSGEVGPAWIAAFVGSARAG